VPLRRRAHTEIAAGAESGVPAGAMIWLARRSRRVGIGHGHDVMKARRPRRANHL